MAGEMNFGCEMLFSHLMVLDYQQIGQQPQHSLLLTKKLKSVGFLSFHGT
jgi:hypothetical protein